MLGMINLAETFSTKLLSTEKVGFALIVSSLVLMTSST